MKLKVVKLQGFKGELPTYATSGSSGFDVRACIESTPSAIGQLTIPACQHRVIRTRLAFEVPEGYELQVRPRSGMALWHGITVLNSPGTIDSDYRDEVKIILINHTNNNYTIRDQDRIAQLILCPVIKVELEEVESLSAYSQKDAEILPMSRVGGFGSTGK